MKEFDSRVNVGTKVMFLNEWYVIKELNESRTLAKLDGVMGSFQANHFKKFSNKAGK